MADIRGERLSGDELFKPITVDFHWALNVFPPLIGAADRIRGAIKASEIKLPDSLREKVLSECNFIINKSSQVLVELNSRIREGRSSAGLQ